jgi:hypothetical protein
MEQTTKTEWDYDQKNLTRSIRINHHKKYKKEDNYTSDKPIKKEKRINNKNFLRYWDSDLEDL